VAHLLLQPVDAETDVLHLIWIEPVAGVLAQPPLNALGLPAQPVGPAVTDPADLPFDAVDPRLQCAGLAPTIVAIAVVAIAVAVALSAVAVRLLIILRGGGR